VDILDEINLIDVDELNCECVASCDENYCDCDRYDGCDDGNY